jgi:hypothetical protein
VPKVKKNSASANSTAANVGYEAELWQMADALSGSVDAAEYAKEKPRKRLNAYGKPAEIPPGLRPLLSRQPPDIEDSTVTVPIGVAFRKRDPPVNDDRTVPVAAATVQLGKLAP